MRIFCVSNMQYIVSKIVRYLYKGVPITQTTLSYVVKFK